MKTFTLKALAVAVLGGSLAAGTAAAGLLSPPQTLKDQGVGLYTGPSVAHQVSTFTLNRTMVSCGVGTVDALGVAGPFEMIMYSLNVGSYNVDRASRTITATGTMRSTTRMAGLIIEDTDGSGLNPEPHSFVAFGFDNGSSPDRYELHFKTPFWNTTNPACTPSTVVAGGCRFGENLFLGDINVGK
ncbi:MAG: hypothetical protein M3414_05450 [Pseudomonadota bacterium]|nr:hypothetical protein [Pseudomonadota bacterium]